MDKVIINKLKDAVNVESKQLSSIIFKRTLSSSGSSPIIVQSTSETTDKTFVKSHDGKCLVNSPNTSARAITDMGVNNGYVYVRVSNVDYPYTVAVEFYPKYNFTTISVNHISDLSPDMIDLQIVNIISDGIVPTGNENLTHYSPDGDISILNSIPSIQEVVVKDEPLNKEALTGDIGKLGAMTNLTKLHTRGCLIYGDLAETLDAMVANGRTEGELQFKCWSTKVVLTYNDTVIRVGPSATTHQSGDVYGWRIGFSDSGWDVLETYTTI